MLILVQVMHSPPRKLTAKDQEEWRIRKSKSITYHG